MQLGPDQEDNIAEERMAQHVEEEEEEEGGDEGSLGVPTPDTDLRRPRRLLLPPAGGHSCDLCGHEAATRPGLTDHVAGSHLRGVKVMVRYSRRLKKRGRGWGRGGGDVVMFACDRCDYSSSQRRLLKSHAASCRQKEAVAAGRLGGGGGGGEGGGGGSRTIVSPSSSSSSEKHMEVEEVKEKEKKEEEKEEKAEEEKKEEEKKEEEKEE